MYFVFGTDECSVYQSKRNMEIKNLLFTIDPQLLTTFIS